MVLTGQQLIDRAGQLAQLIGSGESYSGDEADEALNVANDMIESWNLQNFYIYSHVDQTFNLTANDGTYTIGSGGNFNTTRPIGIRSGYTSLNGVDYPLLVIGDAEYNQIYLKSLTGSFPIAVNNDNAYPLATLTFWPLPLQNMTVTLNMDTQLSSITSLSTSIDLPPGYSKLLRYKLAIELANEARVPVPPGIEKEAADIMGNIKVANLPDDVLNFDPIFTVGPFYTNGRIL